MRDGRHDAEAGEAVERELDAGFAIERRARDARKAGRDEALEEMWWASERRERERRRRRNAALWYEFHMRLCEAHAAISREHEQKGRWRCSKKSRERTASGAEVRNVPTQKARPSWALARGHNQKRSGDGEWLEFRQPYAPTSWALERSGGNWPVMTWQPGR
jgi:hypothetical protein